MDPNGTVSASPWSAQEGADDSSPFDQNDPADLNAACAIDHQANNQNARGVDMGDIETWLANEQQGAEAAAGPDGVDSPDEEETGEELDPDLEEMAEVEDLFDGPDDELFDDEDYEDEWYHQYYDEDQYPINLVSTTDMSGDVLAPDSAIFMKAGLECSLSVAALCACRACNTGGVCYLHLKSTTVPTTGKDG